jgi:hypothetical protein
LRNRYGVRDAPAWRAISDGFVFDLVGGCSGCLDPEHGGGKLAAGSRLLECCGPPGEVVEGDAKTDVGDGVDWLPVVVESDGDLGDSCVAAEVEPTAGISSFLPTPSLNLQVTLQRIT